MRRIVLVGWCGTGPGQLDCGGDGGEHGRVGFGPWSQPQLVASVVTRPSSQGDVAVLAPW